MSGRIRWWHVRDSEEGLGLIEVMIAIFVLAVALAALASVGISSLASLRITRDREQATNAASAAIEDARSRDFSGLAQTAGSIDIGRIPPNAVPDGTSPNTCFGNEPIVTDAVVDPIPFERQMGNGGHIRVHTIVTYDISAQDPPPASCTGTSDLKRVTAIASWLDGNVTRFVQQDTLVAMAGRGLPVPKFEVRPPEASLNVSKAFLTDVLVTDKRRCVEQQLRNMGAEDGYEWEVEQVVDGAGAMTPVAHYDAGTPGFKAGPTGEEWVVTAHMEYPAVDELRGGDPPPGDAMTEAGHASTWGGARPASGARIDPTQYATFTVCYEPGPGTVDPVAEEWPADLTFTIAVHSRFDDRQLRRVVHYVSVRDQAAGDPFQGEPFYLFDWNDTSAHVRTQPKPDNPNQGDPVLLPLSMGPLAPPSTDPSLVNHLGTIDYANPALSNWSTDVGANQPGVQLRNVSPTNPGNPALGAHTAAWHHQVPAVTDLLREASLVVWSAPASALPGGTLPVGGSTVTLEVRVDALKKNESTVEWGPVLVTHTYTHDTPGWVKLEIPIDLGQERRLAKDQYLRLRLTCATTSAEDCNLAYDNTAYDSALYVQRK